jgi:succinyl-diaminopimelate desuccinylase
MKKHDLKLQLMSFLEINDMKDIGIGNPIELTKDLISCRSITPENDGAIEQVSHWLQEIGFKSEILNFEEAGTASVKNLWSKIGSKGPTICFAGHTDVVPTGNIDEWSSDPFDASEINNEIIGRGATDMKGAIAAFISATKRFVEENPNFPGSIGFIITGDEEGCAINGTKKILGWMKEKNITFDDCIVGEPTNPNTLGEMIKIGRRGSVNGVITVEGVQGHVAYPHLADNPIPKLIKLIDNLINSSLDEGTDHFQPSNIEITSIDIGNKATNVIPRKASANFNIRYNDLFDSKKIEEEVHKRIESLNYNYSIKFEHSGDAFLTRPGKLTEDLSKIIENQTGHAPELSTSGGTSDARFIKDYGNVVEFGLIGATMHKVDESASIEDIKNLSEIYYQALKKYFY